MEFVNMTSKEYREFVTKNLKSGPKKLGFEQKTSKYHSKKTQVDGKTFDSQKEARRYLVLKEWQRQGKIRDLECQKAFLLQEGFVDNQGHKQRPIYYVCDFLYYDIEKDRWIVEDVKSHVTSHLDAYRIKKKMFLKQYQGCYFNEEI